MADDECGGFSGGSLAGAVIGTFLATLVLGAIIYFLWDRQRKRRLKNSGLSNLVIVEDGGGTPGKNFTYDNPGFIEDSTDAKKGHHASSNEAAKQNGKGKPVANQEPAKKMPWGPLSFLFKSRTALDDSVLEEPQRYSVALKGHDFTGLGFNICGNMRDGIFVKDVMQRGPAAESKQILPGDQITQMTVCFKHMVLEDAMTLLSYASPYAVNMDMLRLSDKSLPHKGIMVSNSHPSGSSSNNTTLERVCHPFFKSQSIDDLRKVGKEHLDLKVDRVKRHVNGVNKPIVNTSLDIPTAVIVVPNGENRSSASTSSSSVKIPSAVSVNLPNVNKDMMHLNKNASKNALEAHQKNQADRLAAAVDEVDACRVPIPIVQQEIKVSGMKPEIVPRAKSKTVNVKAAPNVPVVEAISPVVKMAYEKEKQEKEEAMAAAAKAGMAVLDIKPVEIQVANKPSVKVETSMDVEKGRKHEKGPSMIVMDEIPSCWNQHLGTDPPTPDVSLTMEKEKEPLVKKPQRGQKTKDKVKPEKENKNKEKDNHKEKEKDKKEKESSKEPKEKDGEHNHNGEKSKFSKFGIRVLPDISLNFGKGSKSSEKDKEGKEEKESKKDVKEVKESKKDSKEEKESKKDVKEEKESKKEKEKQESKDKDGSEMKDTKKEKEPKEKSSKSKDKKEGKDHKEKSPSPNDTSNVNANEADSSSSSSVFKINMPSVSLPKVEIKRKDSKGNSESSSNGNVNLVPSDINIVTPDQPTITVKQQKAEVNDMDEHVPELPSDSSSVTVEMKSESRPPSADSAGSGTGEKKKGGFHMPSLGIKLPKFGSSKQTYSFENTGDKDSKHSHSVHSDDLMIVASPPSLKTEVSASAPEFKKMKVTSDADDITIVEKVSSAEMIMEEIPSAKANVSLNLNVGESGVEEKSMVMPVSESTETQSSAQSSAVVMKEDGTNKEIKDKENSKPGFMSKGLKGLREFKDKVTHKLSHEQTETRETSSEEEAEDAAAAAADKPPKDKLKKTKKDKERDKSADAKREKEEKAKQKAQEKERIKAEKKLKKEQLKKKSSSNSTKECGHSSASSTSSSDESEGEDVKDQESKKKKIKTSKMKEKKIKGKGGESSNKEKVHKENEKKDKKKDQQKEDQAKTPEPVGAGSEQEKSIESIQVSQSQSSVGTAQIPLTAHEAKLIPAKPPVAPRKSQDSLTDSNETGKAKKKSKSSSSSSSSSESDGDEKDASGKEKPKKPKRSTKRKAPIPPMEISSVESSGAPVTITTSAEVMTPPKEFQAIDDKTKKSKPADLTIQVNNSSSNNGPNSDDKTPDSGRRSASFGDLSSLQSKSEKQTNQLLERAVSMDLAADSEQSAMIMSTSSKIPVGSPLEDLSAMPDSTTIIPHFRQRDSVDSLSSSSSSETLKASPTSVVHVFPKETLTVVTHTHSSDPAHTSPTSTQINITNVSTTTTANPSQPSDIQKMMNETISMMNNIVHTMETPVSAHTATNQSQMLTSVGGDSVTVQSHPHTHIHIAPTPISEVNITNTITTPVQSLLVKSADIPKPEVTDSQVTISTTGSSVLEKSELEKIAQEAIDEIMSQVRLNGQPIIASTTVSNSAQGKVTFNNTDESNANARSMNANNIQLEPVNVHSTMTNQSQVFGIKVNGGGNEIEVEAPTTTAVQVKGVEMAMDVVEPVSQKNITVMNIKNAPKQDYEPQVDSTTTTTTTTEDSTITTTTIINADADADAKAQQLLRGDSKSRLMQTVADANNIKVNPVSPNRRDSASMSSASSTSSVDSSPDIRSDSKPIFADEKSANETPTNGQTIEISSTELDGIMMSHAEFLAKQAAVIGASEKDLKDVSFDNWVYVDQKNSSDPSTTSSHSDLEPSNSSNDDEDIPYNRNGALSPTTFKMETQYETAELRVTSSPVPPKDSNNKTQTKVYSTTMTLPQKTVTQIVLGQDPAEGIANAVDSATTTITNGGSNGGLIVSKITLDTTPTDDKTIDDLTTLPKLEALK